MERFFASPITTSEDKRIHVHFISYPQVRSFLFSRVDSSYNDILYKTINWLNSGCEKRLLSYISNCNINRNSNLQKIWCQMCTYSFEWKTLISVYTYRYVEWHPFVLFSSSFGCYTVPGCVFAVDIKIAYNGLMISKNFLVCFFFYTIDT